MAVITNADLTEGTNAVLGAGVADLMMQAVAAHLEDQYKKSRIKGTDYANVYATATQTAMGQAVQFLLQRDAQAKQADLIQAQIDLAVQELANKQQELALAVKQEALMDKQILLADKQVDLATKELALKDKQIAQADAQIAKMQAEVDVLVQRLETEYAQTHDTLSDNLTPVLGQLGKQNDVRDEQIKAFTNSHIHKTAELMQSIWKAQRGTDPGFPTSAEANNTANDVGGATAKLLDTVGVTPSTP